MSSSSGGQLTLQLVRGQVCKFLLTCLKVLPYLMSYYLCFRSFTRGFWIIGLALILTLLILGLSQLKSKGTCIIIPPFLNPYLIINICCSGPFTVSQNFLRSILHAFSYYSSQVLMMIFMAYNGYFCTSLVLGRFSGYFFFSVFMPEKSTIGDRPKSCCG